MSLNKYAIAEKVGERAGTREEVAKALGEDASSKDFAKAFDNAATHGLIGTDGDKNDAAAQWTQTQKGKQKVADNNA
ncbi:MAG: hypothetical protein QOG62_2836 [Thermoleophilaceae bacterium]|nr:hypothetical protein [Thermoleophilaceae bacterium]